MKKHANRTAGHKQLRLSTQTLRTLHARELEVAVGAGRYTQSCDPTCPKLITDGCPE